MPLTLETRTLYAEKASQNGNFLFLYLPTYPSSSCFHSLGQRKAFFLLGSTLALLRIGKSEIGNRHRQSVSFDTSWPSCEKSLARAEFVPAVACSFSHHQSFGKARKSDRTSIKLWYTTWVQCQKSSAYHMEIIEAVWKALKHG